jgi:hypothetical protein
MNMPAEAMMIDFAILMSTMLWILLWRGMALWYSSRNKDKFWYVINLIDPVAVLPILYLFVFSKTPLLKEMEKWGEIRPRKKKSRRKKKKR